MCGKFLRLFNLRIDEESEYNIGSGSQFQFLHVAVYGLRFSFVPLPVEVENGFWFECHVQQMQQEVRTQYNLSD